MTARHEHRARAEFERLHHEVRVNAPGAHHHDVARVGRVLEVAHAGVIGAQTAAPTTGERQHLLFGLIGEQSVNLRQDLPVGEVPLRDRVGRTFRHTRPAGVTLRRDDLARIARPRLVDHRAVGTRLRAHRAFALGIGVKAARRVHIGDDRIDLPLPGGEHARGAPGGGAPLRHALRDVLRPLRRSGQIDAFRRRVDWFELGVRFQQPAGRIQRHGERARQFFDARRGDRRCRQAHHLELVLHLPVECGVVGLHSQVLRHRVFADFGGTALHEVNAGLPRAFVEFLVGLARCADVDAEDGDVHLRVEPFEQQRVFDRVHAAEAGAVLVVTLVARTDALNQAQRLGRFAVGRTNEFAYRRAASAVQTFDFHHRRHVVEKAEAVFFQRRGVPHIQPGRHDDRTHIQRFDFWLFVKADGL